MEYELSWWERIDDKWVRQCKPISEQEFQEIKSTKTITGFKEGSVIGGVQLVSTPEPLKPYNPELKQTKQKQNKKWYQSPKQRW